MTTVREKYRTLVELAPDAIFLIDSSGTIAEANEKAADLLDYEQSHLEGTEVTELHPNEQINSSRKLFEQTISQGELRTETFPNGDQIYLKTRTETRVPVELHAKAIQIEGETCIFTIARDITQRYEREQELKRHRDQLEEFANIVAHDLRNPLNVAEIRLGLAQEDCESEHLDILDSALDRMETLIENTLMLAEQGQTITEWEQVRLVELLRGCWKMVETDAASIEIDLPEDTVVHCDPDRLQQVFENLFRNAIEHGNEPHTIQVTIGESAIYVEDDGPGIPPDKREEVFEVGETTSDTGTGFGLAIIARICEAHGWDIQVTEGELGGARFEITGVDIT
jgi:PAS domain S-box-containing protein